MKKSLLLVLSALFMTAGPVFGQEKLKMSGWTAFTGEVNVDNDFANNSNTFSMKNVRLVASGDLNEKVSYKVQGEFCSSPSLVDAYFKYKVNSAFAVQVGQFHLPFSLESLIAPLSLEAVDFGVAVKKLVGYTDVCGVGSKGRDLGISFSGSLFDSGDGFNYFSYNVGLFNGHGANSRDANKYKDVVGRLDFRPIKPLLLSGSFYLGETAKDATRNRFAASAQYDDGQLNLRSEYIWGETGTTNFKSSGMYAQAGWWFDIDGGNKGRIMPLLRYEMFNENTNANDKANTEYYTIGCKYTPYPFLIFKVNASHLKAFGEDAGNQLLIIAGLKF